MKVFKWLHSPSIKRKKSNKVTTCGLGRQLKQIKLDYLTFLTRSGAEVMLFLFRQYLTGGTIFYVAVHF